MGMLDGKVAVITGAGSGMAKASVKVFVREGAERRRGRHQRRGEGHRGRGGRRRRSPVHCDVTKEADVEAAIRAAVDEFGRLDVVCNVAGIADGVMLADVTEEHYDRHDGRRPARRDLGMKHGIRAMLEHGDGGSIVNWSSIGGLNASSFTGVYSAAKAGVIAVTKTGGRRVRPHRASG